ncbi:KTSC domain-containing protein [Camelliibacillus cellulosilyticus]|uniref:KTSC domain-containing protein n=1 Tax=Camelliibacillus cellulosilyticus TaxID=2174486 RepID=A0ABV9GLD4_9BACL
MQYVKFDPNISHLKTFDTIGYDVVSETLCVMFFDGTEEVFVDVPERTVYRLLLSTDKERYFRKKIQTRYFMKKAEISAD